MFYWLLLPSPFTLPSRIYILSFFNSDLLCAVCEFTNNAIESWNGSIIECLWLEGTLEIFKFKSFAMGMVTFYWNRLPRFPSNVDLNISRDGASTSSLYSLFLCITILIVNNFFLMPYINIYYFSLEPLALNILQLSDCLHGTPLDPL